MARKFYTPINLTGLELNNFRVQNLPDNPTAYGKGHLYYNTAHNEFRVYDGAVWMPVGGAIEYGLFADRPAAGNSGRVYASTDTKVLYLDNGSTWLQIGIGAETTDTLKNKSISGSDNTLSNIGNSSLTNSSITINGVTFNLGDSNTIAAATPNALTFGTGLESGSFDGSSAVTINVDETVIATKSYVDSVAQGLSVLGSVRAASSANVSNLSSVTAVGGVTLNNGDRVLLKNQATATQNGIYIYNSGTTTLVPSTNLEDADLKQGSYTLVTEGDHATQGWIITAYSAGASTWTQFSAAGEYTAGDGIDISAGVISAKVGDGLDIDGSGNIAVDTTKVVYKYATTITGDSTDGGVTGTKNFTITHNLGTSDIQVAVYDATTKEEVITDILYINTTSATVGFAMAPLTTDSYRVVVQA